MELITMKKKINWTGYLFFFLAFAMLGQNIIFLIRHVGSEYSNLGIALMGIPSNLLLLSVAIQHSLGERKRVVGFLLIIAAPILFTFELIIHFLQEPHIRSNLVIWSVVYAILFVLGCEKLYKSKIES